MKFLQHTSREASTASHCYNSPTPCWLSQYCTLLPTFWQDTQVIHSCISCTYRHRGPKDDSFQLVNSAPVLAPSGTKPIHTDWHRYETQQEAGEAVCSNRVSTGAHNQTSNFPAIAVLWATGRASRSLSGEVWPHSGHSSPLPLAPAESSAHPERTSLYRTLLCMGTCTPLPRRESLPRLMHPQGPLYTAGVPPWCSSQPLPSSHGGERIPKVPLNLAVLSALCITQMHLACAPATKLYLLFIILSLYISSNSLL